MNPQNLQIFPEDIMETNCFFLLFTIFISVLFMTIVRTGCLGSSDFFLPNLVFWQEMQYNPLSLFYPEMIS